MFSFIRVLATAALFALSFNTFAVTWTSSVPLNTDAASDFRIDDIADIAMDGQNAVAVWTAAVGGGFKIYTARSSNAGATWSSPVLIDPALGTGEGHNYQPTVETDGNGMWVCAWMGLTYPGPDSEPVISRSFNNGLTWSPPVAINTDFSTDGKNEYAIQLKTDGNGVWTAVWTRVMNGTSFFWARSTDNTLSWSPPQAFTPLNNTHTEFGARPSLDTDREGNWIATIESDNYTSATTGGDWEIFCFRSSDNCQTWLGPTLVNANFASDGGDAYSYVATDRRGKWIAIWATFTSIDGLTGTDGDIAYAVSTDNGETWGAVAALNADAATDSRWDTLGEIATDRTGNWIAVWQTQAPGDHDVFSAQSTDNGVTWTGLAAMNSRAAIDSRNDNQPRIETNGEGDWLSAWPTYDSQGNTIGTEGDVLFSRATLEPQLADLSLTKSDNRDPIAVGNTFTYTLRVESAGTVAADPVILVDSLPAEVQYVSHTVSQGSCVENANSVTCDLGALSPGGDAVVSITVMAVDTGTAVNIATVGAPQFDNNNANNTAEESTEIALSLPGPDLTVSWSSLSQSCRGYGTRRRCKLTGTVIVSNMGQAGARPTSVLLYLSDDQVLDPSDQLLARRFSRNLRAGSSQRIGINLPLPRSSDYTGQYIIAVVDLENGVVENDEDNNTIPSHEIP